MSNYLIPGEVRCWSCGKWMSNNELENADGCCPFCDEEICTNEPPYTSDSEQGGPMKDITALMATMKAAAEKATPGEWSVQFGDEVYATDGVENEQIAIATNDARDADFIALANPANVRALVEALEKAQQQTTESENRVRKHNRHICELFDDNTALRQRIASLEESHAQVIQSRDHYKRMSEEGLKQLVESRTVTVKLPTELELRCSDVCSECAGNALQVVEDKLRAAGIQVIEGEGQ